MDGCLNQDFPLAVDIVVVYDKDLYGELKKLSAEDWFGQRAQLRLENEPKKLEVTSKEWVPPCPSCPARCKEPTLPGPVALKFRIGARGGIVFANYFNPGR